MLREWYNLVYNPQNGQMLTKKQYAKGSIMEIYEHDRNGAVWRRIKCFDFFPSTPPTGLNEDNYDNMGDAKTVSITFMVDDWVEELVGLKSNRSYSSGGILDNYNTNGHKTSEYGNIYTRTGKSSEEPSGTGT
jgi:hypothetical protein